MSAAASKSRLYWSACSESPWPGRSMAYQGRPPSLSTNGTQSVADSDMPCKTRPVRRSPGHRRGTPAVCRRCLRIAAPCHPQCEPRWLNFTRSETGGDPRNPPVLQIADRQDTRSDPSANSRAPMARPTRKTLGLNQAQCAAGSPAMEARPGPLDSRPFEPRIRPDWLRRIRLVRRAPRFPHQSYRPTFERTRRLSCGSRSGLRGAAQFWLLVLLR